MKRFLVFLLTCILGIGTTTAFAANELMQKNSKDKMSFEEEIEVMEKIGFLQIEDSVNTREGILIEATRYDGETSEMLVSEKNGNKVIEIESEGKSNILVITPNGEYYWDEVAEENRIKARIMNDELKNINQDPRATSENWITDITPYDNGPYKYNKNMTKK